MLCKWILCRVPTEGRAAFSKAQENWQALQGVDGFGGQWGGWNADDVQEACILGLWRDLAAYQQFMANVHDTIFEKSDQGRTYDTISVTLYEQVEVVDLPAGSVLRVELTPGISCARLAADTLQLPADLAGAKRIGLLDTWSVEGGSR
ncbi:YdbC family protein [Tumebacillus permanentifrigoris]|uniref:Uncharacterized protein DUF4937 n=1 Tax=Tumebacillus permanentifrigoris TaxID=378543 RepID=A0A316DZB4_9BACL|nr:YdbC family protein [Tumebacillus permanentifrigoris]PWK15850.1 uncharacterized protein DUF4937 [Tumebacillus permanentifrigoris]